MPPVTDLAIPTLVFAAGMAALVLGGHWLVEGSVRIARKLGWSPLLIGLTLVAFGTSAPEFAFNVAAAISGEPDLSFGNVIGSNIANIGLVLGVGGLLHPLVVHRRVARLEIPRLLMISAVITGLLWMPFTSVNGGPGFGRLDGLAMLLGFGLILFGWYRLGQAPGDDDMPDDEPSSWASDITFSVLGLTALVGGGKLAEHGAVEIASTLGASETVIGLTIVAIATSLPELVTVVIACRKGHTDLAVGNIVGSNLFNLLLVLASSVLVTPIPLPAGGLIDVGVMLVLTALLWPFAATSQHRVSRLEALLLLIIYAGWLTFRVMDELRG